MPETAVSVLGPSVSAPGLYHCCHLVGNIKSNGLMTRTQFYIIIAFAGSTWLQCDVIVAMVKFR